MSVPRTLTIVSLTLGSLLRTPGAAFAQCAMCRSAFASPEGQQLVAAFRISILFLLATTFASFATVAFLAVRRQQHRDVAQRGEPGCRVTVDHDACKPGSSRFGSRGQAFHTEQEDDQCGRW